MRKPLLAALTLLLGIAAIAAFLLMDPWSGSSEEPKEASNKTDILTTVFSLRPSLSFKNGENIEDNVHTRFVRDHLGIDIQYLWTAPDSTFTTRLKLQLLNKREMPDIIPVRTDVIHELIDSGQFMAVDEVFEKHASPVWKKALAEAPSVWSPYARDGKHYAIPILDYDYNSDPMMWIREDWLEKVGLPAPATLAELEKVLDAFTNGDPDGNHKRDTYGIAVSMQRQVNTWMADIGWVFGMYGVLPGQWNRLTSSGKPDQLGYGTVQEQAKQGLLKIREWKKAGYFPDEAMWQDEETAARLFAQGKAGIVVGPNWMRYWPLNDMSAAGANARFKAIAMPSGPKGPAYHWSPPPRNGAILINKSIKDPEPFFRYINFLYEHQGLGTGEYAFGMARNYDYAVVNGMPSADRSLIPGGYVDVSAYTLIYDGARIPSSWTKNLNQTEVPILTAQAPTRLPSEYQGPPTLTMKEKWDQLLQTEHEALLQIIYGKKGLSYFDQFVTQWRNNGGDRITGEVNAWYRANQDKK